MGLEKADTPEKGRADLNLFSSRCFGGDTTVRTTEQTSELATTGSSTRSSGIPGRSGRSQSHGEMVPENDRETAGAGQGLSV